MAEIDRSTLSAQIILAPKEVGSGDVAVITDSPIVGISTSQTEAVSFQADITSSIENMVGNNSETHSVPLNDSQKAVTTFSGDVPVFTESLSVEMVKKWNDGKAGSAKEKSNKNTRRKEIREQYGLGAGTAVDDVDIKGKGQVPCKKENGKWVPLS